MTNSTITQTANNSIYIPGDVPSSKNSKVWTGKFLVSSKATQRYVKNSEIFYSNRKTRNDFWKMLEQVQKPYKIGFYFERAQKRKFDYSNMSQIIQDLMVQNGWLDDDNCDEMIPVFLGYVYNKQNPGVHISVVGAILNKTNTYEAIMTRAPMPIPIKSIGL